MYIKATTHLFHNNITKQLKNSNIRCSQTNRAIKRTEIQLIRKVFQAAFRLLYLHLNFFEQNYTMKPTLLVLAAGLGSRYGSLKQMDHLGPNGESIIDYSVFDAARAGCGKVVFVLREEIVEDFYSLFANRYKNTIEVDHVVQRLSDIPDGIVLNPERVKPWGTCHAVLAATEKLSEPFAVINGDDFYGFEAFVEMGKFLSIQNPDEIHNQAMVGYILNNTLSDHGFVSRGVCTTNQENYLTGVTERTHIETKGDDIIFVEGNKTEKLSGNEVGYHRI